MGAVTVTTVGAMMRGAIVADTAIALRQLLPTNRQPNNRTPAHAVGRTRLTTPHRLR